MHQLAVIFIRGDAEKHRDTPVTIDGHCERASVFAYHLLRKNYARQAYLGQKKERERERERGEKYCVGQMGIHLQRRCKLRRTRSRIRIPSRRYTPRTFIARAFSHVRMHMRIISSLRTLSTFYSFIGCIIYISIRLIRERAPSGERNLFSRAPFIFPPIVIPFRFRLPVS